VAGAGGQQAALAGVEDHAIRGHAASDAGRQLSGRGEHVGEAVDSISIDRLTVIRGERELIQRNSLEHARDGLADEFDGVEQRGDAFAHACLLLGWIRRLGRRSRGVRRWRNGSAVASG
jgi:hypothetical protein